MAETLYRLLCTSVWRRWAASIVVGLLLAAITLLTWWEFHVPGPRHFPLWVYGTLLSLITGGSGAGVTHLLLWLWYAEHEVLRRCQAYRTEQVTAVLEMSNNVRNALDVINQAGWLPKDAELYAMVQDSVARIESELRQLVKECDHATHEPPGHGVL